MVVLGKYCIIQFIQRRQLFFVHQIKLVNEKEKMAIACVEVRFDPQSANVIKMITIYMRVYPKQSTCDSFNCFSKVSWKWDADLVRKDGWVVEKALCPVHQRVHILRCRKLCGAFVFDPVLPEIFVSWTGGHDGTFLRGAELRYGPVKHVEMVKEVYHMHREPFVGILAIWQLNSLP